MGNREDVVQLLYGREDTWTQKNLVLHKGEVGYEWDQNRFKIGNGATPWNDLEYYLPESQVRELIEQLVADAIEDLPNASPSGQGIDALVAHVNDPLPHPAYDTGPSFLLLYQNAKV